MIHNNPSLTATSGGGPLAASRGGFLYKKNKLYCENVDIESIADAVGTPFYLYSANTLRHNIQAYEKAFSSLTHLTAYAMKANSNIALLRLLAKEGAGADIVSGGELFRALKAGIDPKKIVFAGVGKTREEMRAALKAKVLVFNVESEQELDLLNDVAKSCKVKAPVALRVNPDVNPKTHPYISTGMKQSKFGIAATHALALYKRAAGLSHINVCGIHSHIGSQLTDVQPFVDAVQKISDLIHLLRLERFVICYWNIGGGLGIQYDDKTPALLPHDLADKLLPILKKSGCKIIMEPGRSIVGNAGVLVTRALYIKKNDVKQFVVVDAGMNDLIRPALYDAYHQILPVVKTRRQNSVVDIVGPICESGDFLAKDREMPEVAPHDLLAVMSAGAYGFAMSGNYNTRPRPPEILVDGDNDHVIRKRENYLNLIQGETIPPFLK